MKNLKEIKRAKELTYNIIYERMFLIAVRNKVIKKTSYTNVRLEKLLTIKKTIV